MTPKPEPRRLLDDDDATARLLADANERYDTQLDESGAWRRLQARVETQGTGGHRWSWFAAVALAAAAGAALYAQSRPGVLPTVDVSRERPIPVASAQPPSPAPSASADEIAVAPRPNPVGSPSAMRPVDCTRPMRELEPRDAATCLEHRASAAGLEGERALFNLATLRRERLQDPAGAVAALREHRARYPEGVLRGEVDFALVELLPAVGAVDEALTESGRLLEKPWGKTRASELYLSRGQLYQDRLGDCTRALAELGKIRGEFGPLGDEAEYRAGQCLEQLGNAGGAREAYTRYLTRPSPRHASAARERLDALHSSP